MSQIQTLITTLKQQLKHRGLTYQDIAIHLGLSEASIKRTFAEQSFTLDRLEQICLLMDFEITDLVKVMEANKQRLSHLTEEQEQELVSDIKLLLIAYLIVNAWTAEEIEYHYNLSKHEMTLYLARLDKLRLIELLPGNHIKLLISNNFVWLKNGPIQQLFSAQMEKEFFTSRFEKNDENHRVVSGMLSPKSNDYLIKKMEHLAAQFNELNEQDKHLPLEQRFASIMIMAIRPWRPTIFEQFKRQEPAQE